MLIMRRFQAYLRGKLIKFLNFLITYNFFRLGSDPQKVFPRHAFDDHLKRFGIFGLLMGICVIPIFTSQVEDIPDMDELARKFKETADAGEKPDVKDFINFSSSTSTNACNVRMRDVFIDMYNLGYI